MTNLTLMACIPLERTESLKSGIEAFLNEQSTNCVDAPLDFEYANLRSTIE